MPHTLITGGTGMLKDVSLYYAQHGSTVSVIARNQQGIDELITKKDEYGFINPLRVDYSDYQRLEQKINLAIEHYGKIESCVNWIHSSAPEAPYIIAEILNNQNIKCKFFHVLGCEYADPSLKFPEIEKTFERFVNLIYRKIILGFVVEDEKARWLTKTEIGNGVIDAVEKEKDSFIVGKTEPWKFRPEY